VTPIAFIIYFYILYTLCFFSDMMFTLYSFIVLYESDLFFFPKIIWYFFILLYCCKSWRPRVEYPLFMMSSMLLLVYYLLYWVRMCFTTSCKYYNSVFAVISIQMFSFFTVFICFGNFKVFISTYYIYIIMYSRFSIRFVIQTSVR